MHDTQVERQNLLMFSLMAAIDPSVNMIAFASGKEQAREAFNEIPYKKMTVFISELVGKVDLVKY